MWLFARGYILPLFSLSFPYWHPFLANCSDFPQKSCGCLPENGHRNSGFTHWKWWFSVVMWLFTRGYILPLFSLSFPYWHPFLANCSDFPQKSCGCLPENGHRNSGFTHWKWWFSIVMWLFARGYILPLFSLSFPYWHPFLANCSDFPQKSCGCLPENGHRNSGFTHWKWRFSIVMWLFTRG